MSNRRTFPYEFEICEALVEGSYDADNGHLDTVTLPNGVEIAIDLAGKPMDRGEGWEALTLAQLVARRILDCKVCRDEEIPQTRQHESWAGYAPVVL